jgi:hypothetical protein
LQGPERTKKHFFYVFLKPPKKVEGARGTAEAELRIPGSLRASYFISSGGVGVSAEVFPNPPSNSMAAGAGNKIRNAKLVRILPVPQRSNFGSWYCRRLNRVAWILIGGTGMVPRLLAWGAGWSRSCTCFSLLGLVDLIIMASPPSFYGCR